MAAVPRIVLRFPDQTQVILEASTFGDVKDAYPSVLRLIRPDGSVIASRASVLREAEIYIAETGGLPGPGGGISGSGGPNPGGAGDENKVSEVLGQVATLLLNKMLSELEPALAKRRKTAHETSSTPFEPAYADSARLFDHLLSTNAATIQQCSFQQLAGPVAWPVRFRSILLYHQFLKRATGLDPSWVANELQRHPAMLALLRAALGSFQTLVVEPEDHSLSEPREDIQIFVQLPTGRVRVGSGEGKKTKALDLRGNRGACGQLLRYACRELLAASSTRTNSSATAPSSSSGSLPSTASSLAPDTMTTCAAPTQAIPSVPAFGIRGSARQDPSPAPSLSSIQPDVLSSLPPASEILSLQSVGSTLASSTSPLSIHSSPGQAASLSTVTSSAIVVPNSTVTALPPLGLQSLSGSAVISSLPQLSVLGPLHVPNPSGDPLWILNAPSAVSSSSPPSLPQPSALGPSPAPNSSANPLWTRNAPLSAVSSSSPPSLPQLSPFGPLLASNPNKALSPVALGSGTEPSLTYFVVFTTLASFHFGRAVVSLAPEQNGTCVLREFSIAPPFIDREQSDMLDEKTDGSTLQQLLPARTPPAFINMVAFFNMVLDYYQLQRPISPNLLFTPRRSSHSQTLLVTSIDLLHESHKSVLFKIILPEQPGISAGIYVLKLADPYLSNHETAIHDMVDTDPTDKSIPLRRMLGTVVVEGDMQRMLGIIVTPFGDPVHQPLSVDLCEAFVRDGTLALQHLHSRRVLHRDIKPSNFVYSENRFYLNDFDISSTFDDLSNAGFAGGTQGFRSVRLGPSHRYDYLDDFCSLAISALSLLYPSQNHALQMVARQAAAYPRLSSLLLQLCASMQWPYPIPAHADISTNNPLQDSST